MPNATFSQQTHDLDEWDDILHQLEQQWPLREQVSTTLNEANAAFAAQFMQPDGYKYMAACDRLTNFLNLKIPMEYSEQKLLIQILQVASAMHENAVNNPTLSRTERSAHYLASASLVPLCQSALEAGGATHSELWCEVFSLSCRAEKALSNAIDALDLSKYLDFEKMADDCFGELGNDTGGTSAAPSPVPTASTSATPRVSLHDITDVRQTPRSAKGLQDQPPKGVPLGRAHTMPSLSQTSPSSHYSGIGQVLSKAYSRGPGFHALHDIEE